MDTPLAIETILAGETLSATVEFEDAPTTAGTTLVYTFRAGRMRHQISAAINGTEWDLVVAANHTLEWEPGDCFYSGVYTASGVATEVDSGCILVRQNPMVQSYAERTLDAIRSVIEGRAKTEQLTVQLGDVTLQYMTPAQLQEWEKVYAAKVQAENNRMRRDRGLKSRNRIGTKFV